MPEVGSTHILTIDDCIKYDLIYFTSAAFILLSLLLLARHIFNT